MKNNDRSEISQRSEISLDTGNKLSFGAPTHPVHGSIDAMNELGIKGHRTKVDSGPAIDCI